MALSPAESSVVTGKRLKAGHVGHAPESPGTGARAPNAGAMRWPSFSCCRSTIAAASTISPTRCMTPLTGNACRPWPTPTSRPSRLSILHSGYGRDT